MRRDQFINVLGAVALSPQSTQAQKRVLPVIGFLGHTSADESAPSVAGLRQGLIAAGFVDGQNLAIDFRWAEGHFERLPALAAELVQRQVSVIVALSLYSALAAKAATQTIPIVFMIAPDAVKAGLITSFDQPGGNLTGLSGMTTELAQKRLEILCDLVPNAAVIGFLLPNNPTTESQIADMQQAARSLKRSLLPLKASTEKEIDRAFQPLVEQVGRALIVGTDPFLASRRDQIVALAARHTIPTIYDRRAFVEAGGLISLGASLDFRQSGNYVAKILNGANAGDMPVIRPKKIECVLNSKIAKTLGLTIPLSVQARVSDVIE
jgi:putative ABC transport system substrate-binding protein